MAAVGQNAGFLRPMPLRNPPARKLRPLRAPARVSQPRAELRFHRVRLDIDEQQDLPDRQHCARQIYAPDVGSRGADTPTACSSSGSRSSRASGTWTRGEVNRGSCQSRQHRHMSDACSQERQEKHDRQCPLEQCQADRRHNQVCEGSSSSSQASECWLPFRWLCTRLKAARLFNPNEFEESIQGRGAQDDDQVQMSVSAADSFADGQNSAGRLKAEDDCGGCRIRTSVTFLSLLGADAIWAHVLSFTNCQEAAFVAGCCGDTARSGHDKQGRLLVGSACLPRGLDAAGRLTRLSPHLLVKLSLPCLASGAAGESVLAALADICPELCSLREVSVHLEPPRLPRVSGESREERSHAVSVLAGALSAALPCWLDSFEANLRGGCLLASEGVLADFASAIPKGLTKLGLDLNHFSARDARAIAKMLPANLRQLRLLFHGRSFAWLGAGGADIVGGGAEELAKALPPGLEALHLMMESGLEGAAALCQALPVGLQRLALDLHLISSVHPTAETEHFPRALAAAVPRLRGLQLRLRDFSMSLEGVRCLANALPRELTDLRLDLCCRCVGDDGAFALASNIPPCLERLKLCLREWQMTGIGLRWLAAAMPRSLRQLKLVLSSSPVGANGARSLAAALPPRLTRLNLSFRHCSIGRDGEQALRPLARKWNTVPQCWVRVCEKTSPVCLGLQRCAEWELWDD
eukprot:TRINITY_DN72907_c0_g1_i1.p1 TRINITY_DN72907_c0_g1~~TRINITY_DN72907_c0_g1_i1.p1  ORF type:complete len:695 (+),score=105.72 TRINITY_DN72907_c0_g1_i1:101-2185(+)